MTTITSNPRTHEVVSSKTWHRWAGRVLTALPAGLLILSASLKLMHAPQFVAQWTDKFGWSESSLTTIGILELACLAIFLVPRTAFVGAILLSAYLGGAVVTHARIGEPFVIPIVLGVLIWAGLTLRDERLWSIVFARRA